MLNYRLVGYTSFPFKALLACLFFSLSTTMMAQTGILKGRVFQDLNGAPISFAIVSIQERGLGTYTDSLGRFEIKGISPGLVNVEVRNSGFRTEVIYEVQITNSKPYVLEIAMQEEILTADSIDIVASPFKVKEESPLSLRTIGTSEIKRNPGGNRDISKVIQSLPGVSSTVSFRNDILIRGGGPNENRFYIDGIETPNINHFATQGASGGPVGLINVDFIGEVDFYSGAFPANRGNALSSVFEFQQREARDDRIGFTATVGASDLALTLEGPSGENSSFLFSARRSYLQALFKILGLPFLPTYNDYQYKHKFRFGKRHELNIISLGALDQFKLNLEADSTEFQKYTLANLPVQTQWNYTIGARYKYFGDQGFWTVVLSRNMLNNRSFKYIDNDESNEKILDYLSQEIENKLRIEYTGRLKGFKWNYGINYEFNKYNNSTFWRRPFQTIDFTSDLNLSKYGAFVQLSKRMAEERLVLSLGSRIDGSSFNQNMRNPFEQFSPRFSASYALTSKLSANFNTGIFYQIPPYTVLGYRDSDSGELKNTDLTYIQNRQIVGGFSYISANNLKVSIEGYFKQYSNYPFLTNDSISLANVGGDFGVVGNEPAISTSNGRTYGLEVLIQQRLYKGFYGIIAYTLGWSEFEDNRGNFVPSSWDSRHIVALTAGKKFKGDWELGAKWRFTSGTPYTPSNTDISSLRNVWDLNLQALPDYENINSLRLQGYHQLDIRVDKKWYFKKWSFNLFLDIQNIYNNSIQGPPIFLPVRDDNDAFIIDANDPSRYQMQFLEDELGIFQPTIGIIITY